MVCSLIPITALPASDASYDGNPALMALQKALYEEGAKPSPGTVAMTQSVSVAGGENLIVPLGVTLDLSGQSLRNNGTMLNYGAVSGSITGGYTDLAGNIATVTKTTGTTITLPGLTDGGGIILDGHAFEAADWTKLKNATHSYHLYLNTGGAAVPNNSFSGSARLLSISGPGANAVGNLSFKSSTELTAVSLPAAAAIGNEAFHSCTSLTSINLPAAADIEDAVFAGCTGLTAVSLPVTTAIGTYTLADCAGLTKLNLPVVTTVKRSGIADCTNLTSLNLPAVKVIENSAFQNCTGLTELNLPAATDIEISAFQNCTSLTDVSLPEATAIGSSAFKDCTSLRDVNLPKAVTIGYTAFMYCKSLTNLQLPEAKDIGYDAFDTCSSITEISLPEAVNIGNTVFRGCTSLKTVNAPKAETIGERAFNACTSLNTANLPKAETIGERAFGGCTSLIDVNLSNAADIGNGLFAGCTSLTAQGLTISASGNNFTLSSSVFYSKDGKTAIASIPGSLPGTLMLPDAETIGAYAFTDCKALISLNLPLAAEIGDAAFSGCSNLTSLNLRAAENIGSSSFRDCEALKSVHLPKAKTIGNGAFDSCSNLTGLNLPAATVIGRMAFRDCTDLKLLALPDAKPVIQPDAFNNVAPLLLLVKDTTGYGSLTDFPAGTKAAEQPAVLQLTETDLELKRGQTASLLSTGSPIFNDSSTYPNGKYAVLWSSDNESAATVDADGKVTAGSAGTATITGRMIYDGTVAASCTVTVKSGGSGPNPSVWVVDFDLNGGSGSIASQAVFDGKTASSPPVTPVRENHSFTGWYTDKEATKPYSFAAAVTKPLTLYAGWKESTLWQPPFTDVKGGSWYYGDVAFVHTKGLMEGVSGARFAPGSTVTRGMLAVILWRMEGEPEPVNTGHFGDLTQDWYKKAVSWAAENGIVEGYGNRRFGPEDPLTREQMVTMLYRYAQFKDSSIKAQASTAFTDKGSISSWAADAVEYCVQNKIVLGKPGNLFDPQAPGTRAQLAAVLHRFLAV